MHFIDFKIAHCLEQEKTLQAKQQRLNFLTQQSQQHGLVIARFDWLIIYPLVGDNDRLRKLREKVLDQEDRLRLLRVGPEQNTALLSAELDSVRNLLEAKQRELSNSMQKVEQLTHVLSELRKSQIGDGVGMGGVGEVGKLNRELGALHSLNSDQSARLQQQRDLLRKKQEESQELDRKILDLADRITKKRAAQSASGALYTNVAAVEPTVVNPNQPANRSKADSLPAKQTVLNNIAHRSDIAPVNQSGEVEENHNPPARRDVKPSLDGKKRSQRPISDLFRPGEQTKNAEQAKNKSSIFQYRNPPEDKNRPPPPSYQSAVNSRRSLPGQPSRGKLVAQNKAPGNV